MDLLDCKKCGLAAAAKCLDHDCPQPQDSPLLVCGTVGYIPPKSTAWVVNAAHAYAARLRSPKS